MKDANLIADADESSLTAERRIPLIPAYSPDLLTLFGTATYSGRI